MQVGLAHDYSTGLPEDTDEIRVGLGDLPLE